MNENRLSQVLKEFDKKFQKRSSERLKNKTIIMNIFQQFLDEIYEADEIYKKATNTKEKIIEEFKLDERQTQLMERLQDCQNTIEDDLIERAFIYGFMISDEIKEESKKDNG